MQDMYIICILRYLLNIIVLSFYVGIHIQLKSNIEQFKYRNSIQYKM